MHVAPVFAFVRACLTLTGASLVAGDWLGEDNGDNNGHGDNGYGSEAGGEAVAKKLRAKLGELYAKVSGHK